ncbi:hypothetical protein PA598K_06878 [Paenibacillus sp. 598K]|uniref:hypothetical protein n=1 Tax=Paenibacillus sp. 598K TaxID=1117987 RepID=UPI000FFA9671|nr:hypothetical protein [Paenibacillus sp. 598K]GBF78260.1 hypothetical protein PA598K_06878 [Paenibacillus sp. 598K]
MSKKLKVTVSFVDKEGNKLSVDEAIAKTDYDQQAKIKALIMEASTGHKYIPVPLKEHSSQ